jgi:metal-sulfur cluster biosynthetic enzyme
MISQPDIKNALKTILDPELGYNIVDLGLIYKIEILPQKNYPTSKLPDYLTNIIITMTLTSPGCPLAPYFIDQVKEVIGAAANLKPDQIEVDITFDPPWSPECLSQDMRLQLGL